MLVKRLDKITLNNIQTCYGGIQVFEQVPDSVIVFHGRNGEDEALVGLPAAGEPCECVVSGGNYFAASYSFDEVEDWSIEELGEEALRRAVATLGTACLIVGPFVMRKVSYDSFEVYIPLTSEDMIKGVFAGQAGIKMMKTFK